MCVFVLSYFGWNFDVDPFFIFHYSKCCGFLQVRVNYYVREVYGDPNDFHDAWDAPFAVLALQGPTKLFVHPVVEKVESTPF